MKRRSAFLVEECYQVSSGSVYRTRLLGHSGVICAVRAREVQGQVRHYGCPQSAFKQDCSSILVPEVLEFCPENCDRERHHFRIAD